VDSGKVETALPAALDSEHQMVFDELTSMGGREFDGHYDQI
jgi:hypothetical protein